MNQASSTIQAPAIPALGGARRRLYPAAAAALLLVAAGIVLTQTIQLAPAATSRAAAAMDGWEAGFVAPANAVTMQDVQDGYLPGFLSTQASGDAVDGYLPGFIATHRIGDATDGWEAGISLRQPARSTVQDGWEAAFR